MRRAHYRVAVSMSSKYAGKRRIFVELSGPIVVGAASCKAKHILHLCPDLLGGSRLWQVVKWMDAALQKRRREEHLAAMRQGLAPNSGSMGGRLLRFW